MEIVTASRRPCEEEVGQAVHAAEPNLFSPARVVDADSGSTVLLLVPFGNELSELRRALLAYPASTTLRSSGIRNPSRVFGFASRAAVLQRTSCRACSGAADAPAAHSVIASTASDLAAQLAGYIRTDEQEALARAAIRPEWFMADEAWWTSGVVNWSSPLPYHRDRNNVPGVWSAMPVVRRSVRGGHLHVPEYGLVLDLRDGDVLYFDGHDLLHGVTPMRRMTKDAYRVSAVYYTIARMASCLSPDEELARGRAQRTASEGEALTAQREHGYLT